jgi:aminoglycoside phosphotransferase family enzyme/predicted kinase
VNDEAEAEVIAWLAARSERVIETALARVFLSGPVAWKHKRAVDFGYVDFSTAERRRWALERELAFNRPAAPDIYRGIRTITRTSDGDLEFDGPGDAVDRVLEMRRFADAAVLAESPAALTGDMAEALGRAIADYHAEAPRRGSSGMTFTVGSNAELLRDLAPQLGTAETEALIAATAAEAERQRPLLDGRARHGFARRCHGDLHLGNILLERDRPVLFDCIEFNDALSDIDVLYDLAFLLMDLGFRDRADAAVRVLSAYLDQAARHTPEELWGGLWEGMAALPLMLSVRGAVRSHVSAHGGDIALAGRYLACALDHLKPAPPRLMAMGGLSGSGKSSLARRLAASVGAAPGGVILRSDEIRKRLAGVGPTERAPAEAYGADADEAAHAAMFEAAHGLLRAGRGVVLDATFLRPERRGQAEAVARAAGVPFDGLWLEAAPSVLEARVAGRSGDASDADVGVLRAQLSRDPGEIGWRRLDATRGVEAMAAAVSLSAAAP